MVPFLIIFLAFIAILTVQLKRTTKAQEEVERRFWNREYQANQVRKQDISKLDYLTLPTELIPGNLGTLAETTLLAMDGVQMLNLTPYTNTDLKLKYGAANIEALSAYEQAYVDMINQLTIYTGELIEAGNADAAQKLLEFAVECGDDSRRIFMPLARIYRDRGDQTALDQLVRRVREQNTIASAALAADLEQV